MDLTGQQWTIVLRQESFNIRFRSSSTFRARPAISAGKALRVLPETELFEPVRNLLHRDHQADFSLPVLWAAA